MANNEEILMKVRVDATQSVKNIAELKIRIEELTAARAELVAGGKKFSDLTAEEQQQYIQLDQSIKAYNKELTAQTRMVQQTIAAEQMHKDTLNGLRAELAKQKEILGRLDPTSPKFKQAAAEVNALNERVKQLEESYGVHQRSVGDYEKANLSLRGEIRQLTEQLAALKLAGKDNTAEYEAMSQRLAQMRDAMNDVSQQTANLASDTSKLDAASKSVGTLMGAFALLNMAMGESAKEDEDVQKTMKAMQVAMVGLTTLTQLSNNLQKQGIIYQTAQNVATKLRVRLEKQKAAAIAKSTTAQVAENAATTADAAAETAATGATVAHTAAQKGLNAAMLANPVFLIIAGLAALAAGIFAVVKAISFFTSGSKEQAEAFDREYELLERNKKAYEEYAAVLDNSSAGDREKAFKRFANLIPVLNEAVALYNKAISDAGKYLSDEEEERINKAEELMKGLRDDYNQQLKAMKVDILSMLDAFQTKQAEAGLSELDKQINGINRELNYTISIVNDLQKRGEITADVAAQAIAAARANAAAETQAAQEAEAQRRKEERRRRAEEYRRRQQEAADAAYNEAMKALEEQGKVDAEQRKRNHASDAEEFAAKQATEKAKLDLQRQYNKITEREYADALRLMEEQALTFAQEQAEKQAEAARKAFDDAIKLAGGKDLAGRLADIKAQYDAAEEAIKNNAELTAEEKTYYLAQLEKRRTDAVKAERDKEGDAERQAAEAAKKAAADAAKARADQLEKDLLIAGNNARARYDIRRAYIEKELAMEGLAAEKKAELEQQLAELRSEYALERINALQDYVGQVQDIMGNLNTIISNMESKRTDEFKAKHDEQKTALDKQLAAGLISQKKYDKAVAKLDEELAAKEAEIAVEQAKREKALSIFQIAVNTAAAIMKIWAEVPKADFGVSTGILTALAAAAGAAQIAAVASQPLPKAAKGGLVEGASHEQGGVLVNMEGGERIVAQDPTRAFPELLNLISYIGKHAAVPDGGYAARAAGLGAAAVAGGTDAAGGGTDIDTLATRIGEQVADALRANPPVMVWRDFEDEQAVRARIADSARG